MCGSMVDIQFPTAENRRGKKKKEQNTGQKYNGRPYFVSYRIVSYIRINRAAINNRGWGISAQIFGLHSAETATWIGKRSG